MPSCHWSPHRAQNSSPSPKFATESTNHRKSLLNQNPSSSPVHILGSLQRSYPAPPGICHTGTTRLMLKNMLGRRCENRWKWLRMYNLTLLEVFWKMQCIGITWYYCIAQDFLKSSEIQLAQDPLLLSSHHIIFGDSAGELGGSSWCILLPVGILPNIGCV